MKKIVIACFATLISLSSFAQIEKGTVLVGASSNLGFESFKPKGGDSESTFSLDGSVGYFIIDNLALGLNLGYAKSGDVSALGVGPMVRYYVGGKFFLGAGYTHGQLDDGTDKVTVGEIPLQAGYAAFLTDNIAVEPSLNFSTLTGDAEGSSFGLSVGFTLYLNRGGK